MILNKANNTKGLNIVSDINHKWHIESDVKYVITCRYETYGIGNHYAAYRQDAFKYVDRTSIFNLKSWGPRGYQVGEYTEEKE